MIASNQQVAYVLIGMMIGFVFTENINGIFWGAIIGFLMSYGRMFLKF